MKKLKILVTGAGSLVGQGILRLLRELDRPIKIFTADPSATAPGHWLGDKAYLIPLAKDPNYDVEIKKIIIKEKIDLIFIGTDVELSYFAENKANLEKLGSKVVICSPELVKIADDKYLTVEFLKQHNFPYPDSALSVNSEECQKLAEKHGFPLFAKPRQGARSVGAKIIKNNIEYLAAQQDPNLIFQELLPDEEYTAGCVGMNGKVSGIVVLKRDLKDGNTIRASHDGSKKFIAEIKEIAEKLNLDGPCNFQFRVKNNLPVIFEINARCSGTTPIRSLFGFNEVEAIINYLIDGIRIKQPKLISGTVLRVCSDILVINKDLDKLNNNKEASNLSSYYMPFDFDKTIYDI